MKTLAKELLVRLLGRRARLRKILLGSLRGARYTIDPSANLRDWIGVFNEPHLQRLLKRHLRHGDTVMDIGANWGFFTLLMARQVGDEGRVLAFEAVPKTAVMLERHLEANRVTNVEVFRKAVSNREGTVTLRVPSGGRNYSMASLHWHKSDPDAVLVEAESMVIDRHPEISAARPRFIKIDVEGAEGEVISGMSELLRRHRPTLFVECSEIGRESVWGRMRELGYRCHRAVGPAEEITDFADYRHADYLWLP